MPKTESNYGKDGHPKGAKLLYGSDQTKPIAYGLLGYTAEDIKRASINIGKAIQKKPRPQKYIPRDATMIEVMQIGQL